jgi:hypothetical protein
MMGNVQYVVILFIIPCLSLKRLTWTIHHRAKKRFIADCSVLKIPVQFWFMFVLFDGCILRRHQLGTTFSVYRVSLWCISKKHFRLGGLAASEWTRSVRAVRDTPLADYSAPGVNTTRRVAYRPPIAVSPFRRCFSFCQSPILNKHSGVVANCDHTSEWVHCVHACIGIAMHKDSRKCADPRNLAKSK